ncbi:MAG: hypothetical protein ACE15F_16370 [bacterium]
MVPELTIQEKLDYLVKTTGLGTRDVIADALEQGITELYRRQIKSAYLNDAINRNEALDRLGEEFVAEIDYARESIKRDVLWGLRRE